MKEEQKDQIKKADAIQSSLYPNVLMGKSIKYVNRSCDICQHECSNCIKLSLSDQTTVCLF